MDNSILPWYVIQNRYIMCISSVIERFGLKYTKSLILMMDLRKGIVIEKRNRPHNLSIRLCTTKDFNSLNACKYTEIKEQFQKHLIMEHKMLAAFSSACVSEQIVGYLRINFQEEKLDISRIDYSEAYITSLNVLPQFRRRRIAQELVRNALRIAQEAFGTRRVYATVKKENLPSLKVFESNGFRAIRVITDLKLFRIHKRIEKACS